MPLPVTTLLPFGKSNTAPIQLSFVEFKRKLTQSRFAGQVALIPDIDLGEFRFKAVIDWIVIRFSLNKITQFRYLQGFLSAFIGEKAYVEPVGPGGGGESSIFDVTIQEPKTLANVMSIADRVESYFGLIDEPKILSVEFSVDAYPYFPAERKRNLLVGVMQRAIFTTRDIWKNSGSRPRSCIGAKLPGSEDRNNRKLLIEGRKGVPGEAYLSPENHRSPYVDGTMYLGDRDKDEVLIRIMNKVLDKQNLADGTMRILTEAEKRVRIEVRIRGKELADLSISTIADFRGFSFSKLQRRYFQFKLATFNTVPRNDERKSLLIMSEIERRRSEILLKSGVLGLYARDQAQVEYRKAQLPTLRRLFQNKGETFKDHSKSMGPTGSFVSYEALNRKISTAFSHLDDSERRSWENLACRSGSFVL